MAADRLPEDPRGRASHKSIVPGRGGESSRLLSVSEAGGGERGRDGIARRNSEASRGDAGLWLSADHGGAAARGLGGESQTSAAADAREQFAVFAAASVCAHHGLGPPVAGVSQPGAGTEGERLESALGGRYYLHSAVSGVCVPGSDSGCVLEAELALEALRMALACGRVAPGLVHHSDQGVQYACGDYIELLTEHGIRISMSRRGNPYDNARAESFIKTLKYEEVYRTEYLDFADARRRIGKFIESVYNRKRLHSALGYLPPAEFEQQLLFPAELIVGQA